MDASLPVMDLEPIMDLDLKYCHFHLGGLLYWWLPGWLASQIAEWARRTIPDRWMRKTIHFWEVRQ